MRRIIIIGGGLSGMLVSLQLLEQESSEELDITVIEKQQPHTIGLAYSTDKDYHLLNVPAARMSAFQYDADHFVSWLHQSGLKNDEKTFYPRSLYRNYILDTLNKFVKKASSRITFRLVNDEAVDVYNVTNEVLLASGTRLKYDHVILALGNFDPAPPTTSSIDYIKFPEYYKSAWAIPDYAIFHKQQHLLILGSGLTMVDAVLSLVHTGYSGKITSLSVHGLIPIQHATTLEGYEMVDKPYREIDTALEIYHILRKHIAIAHSKGINWQAVIDSVRPYTQKVWQNLTPAEKKKFMEHLRHFWGVARHRVAPEAADYLHSLTSQNRLSILAGRVKSIDKQFENELSVGYKPRGQHEIRSLQVNSIINCTGGESNFKKLKIPLIENLLEKGMIRRDELNLGIDCTVNGEVIGLDGQITPGLYTIGPPAKGIFWEITSVPEIRQAAHELAGRLQGRVVNAILPLSFQKFN